MPMRSNAWWLTILAVVLAASGRLSAGESDAPLFSVREIPSATRDPIATPDAVNGAPDTTGGATSRPDDSTALFPNLSHPLQLADVPDDTSVYATPPPPRGDEGANNGGTHFDVNFEYVNRYVYRGVDHDTVATHGNSLNLLFEARLTYDLGKYPHPFFGLFTNIYDADPVSRFQEIRPYLGATWNLRPFLLEAGHIEYIYPQREQFNVPEVYFQFGLDDSLLFHSEEPIFSPYVYAALDYHKNDGWYFEGGIQHEFKFEDIGVVLTPQGKIAYIDGFQQQFVFVNPDHDSGWQHLEFGFTATYSLNTLLNISRRWGEFDAKGYFYYDEKLSKDITANNVLWGGAGLTFKY